MDKKIDMHTENLACMTEKLTEAFKAHIDKGIEQLDVEEAGKVADIIKDLAMAKKYCLESKYYETVTEAMEEAGDEEPERYGYNGRRYSSGRYAPKGRGQIMGYDQTIRQMPYVYDYMTNPEEFERNMRMGYHRDGMVSGRLADDPMRDGDYYPKHGKPYEDYRVAKRHYTKTNSPEDLEMMNEHAKEHLADVIFTMDEIWKEADSELRKKMKSDLTAFVAKLT